MSEEPEMEALRREIDRIDRQILELFTARVRAVLSVGDYKRARDIPVYDADRERSVLDRLCSAAESPLDGDTVRRLFERVIDESRRIEQHHVNRR